MNNPYGEFQFGTDVRRGAETVETYPLNKATHRTAFNVFADTSASDLPIDWVDPRTGESYNPKLGRTNPRTGTVIEGSDRVFGIDGKTLNAQNKVEAIQAIQRVQNPAMTNTAKVINAVQNPFLFADQDQWPEAPVMVNKMHNKAQEMERQMNIISEYLTDPSGVGFQKAGQELLNPIKEVIDYEGWADKVLAPRPVRRGEVVKYDRDVFIVAWAIGTDGETPESQAGGQHFFPPEFEITAFPTIEIKNIYQAQYDILARTQDRSRQAIEYQRDVACKNILDSSATTVNSTVGFTSLTLSSIEQIRYQVEKHRLVADKILINRQELSDILSMAYGDVIKFDPVTQRAAIMMGYVGHILGMKVILSAGTNTFEVVQPGEVYVVTLPEYLGGMPIRVELISQPAPKFPFGIAAQGWMWYTLLSQVVINPAGVGKGVKI